MTPADRHRADYILERGVWRARCRLCSWEVSDPTRRQAASLFRQHIRAAAETVRVAGSDVESADQACLDLAEMERAAGELV